MVRKEQVLTCIKESDKPVSASAIAKILGVSRQIIVGDVALLRAKGVQIIATPRGYVCQNDIPEGLIKTIAVSHSEADLQDELYTIVDLGGEVIDVIVEHPIYGQLSGNLHVCSRYDVDQFMQHIAGEQVRPLSNLTGGLHLHTIRCKDEETYQRIVTALKHKGYLYHKN